MPSLDVPNRLGLKPVLSLHSEVVHVQHLEAGEGIGYGSTYITPEPMTIATIPVGYADGYPRSLSNRCLLYTSIQQIELLKHHADALTNLSKLIKT